MNSFLIIYYTCSIKLYHFKPVLMLCLCPFKHRGTGSMLAKARHIQPGEKYEKRTYMRAVRSHSPTDARQAGYQFSQKKFTLEHWRLTVEYCRLILEGWSRTVLYIAWRSHLVAAEAHHGTVYSTGLPWNSEGSICSMEALLVLAKAHPWHIVDSHPGAAKAHLVAWGLTLLQLRLASKSTACPGAAKAHLVA